MIVRSSSCGRRGAAGLLLLLAALVASGKAVAQTPPVRKTTPAKPTLFSHDVVRDRARALARKAFAAPKSELPQFLRDLAYDNWRDIRYRPERGLWFWEDVPFRVQFFHPGFLYQDPVKVHVVEAGRVTDVESRSDQFNYGKNSFPAPVPPNLGYGGFRIHHPLNRPDYFDEFVVFLGASYFRLVGGEQQYGISARGLAIDTASEEGEEFPRFVEFWIEKPEKYAESIIVHALLDSRSMSGAYRFALRPGVQTVTDVTAKLYARRRVAKLGIAPLTSMFLTGENRTRYLPDFRPEVHDSDGLLVGSRDGQWLWRPLENPERTHRVARFPAVDPVGFGLMQRDRGFTSYEDLEARFERRPSLWVSPSGKWGKGNVELVEIPSGLEANDNVVAYWVPENPPDAGGEIELLYSLHALLDDPRWPPLARTVATRIDPRGPVRFVIDFSGVWMPDLPEDTSLKAEVTASRGEIKNHVVQKNDVSGGWRTFFDLIFSGSEPIDLRVNLSLEGRTLTETWTYTWIPR